jgi:CPA1 family monovalent cation:H+ antiporter
VRSAYVAVMVWLQSRRARGRQRTRLERIGERIDEMASTTAAGEPREPADDRRTQRRIASMRERVARAMRDLNYYQASPLGWKHGVIIVWAGMRGVVTLAAAQTLPRETPERELLIFIAFAVAIGSLMLQGFTLPWLVRLLRLGSPADSRLERAEQSELDDELRTAAVTAMADPKLRRRDGQPFPDELVERVGSRLASPPDDETTSSARDVLELRLVLIEAMRRRLNQLSSGGQYSTPALRHALAELDADQLSLELRLGDDD